MNNKFTIRGKYRYKVIDSLTGEIKRQSGEIENLIVLNDANGLYLLFSHLLGITTNSLEITSASIGTGDTAAAIADTDLETPVLEDIPVALKSRNDDDEIEFTFFINSSDLANGDYKEFGVKCGTKLWARSIITPTFTKSDNEDFQVEYTFTGSTT
jgi:hypothetical protein